MEGPNEYLNDHFSEVLDALKQKDLRPEVYFHSSEEMRELADESVQLVVTSPPYPMIEMWDKLFEKLLSLRGPFSEDPKAFDHAHEFLGKVWSECHRVLEAGGIMCVNIGDATRTVANNFRYYMNHVRIVEICESLGFQSLVPILWRKPTNKPNAFLGSGFYPPNAYVTLDCEFILIFRKGSKRVVIPRDPLRYASQYSKRERDTWFSQIWDIRGASQNHEDTAPFPDELPYRLIRMFSCLGDKVLDPFLGTGRTVRIARALGRKGIGYEFNSNLRPLIEDNVVFRSANAQEILDSILTLYEASEDPSATIASPRVTNPQDSTLVAFR